MKAENSGVGRSYVKLLLALEFFGPASNGVRVRCVQLCNGELLCGEVLEPLGFVGLPGGGMHIAPPPQQLSCEL